MGYIGGIIFWAHVVRTKYFTTEQILGEYQIPEL